MGCQCHVTLPHSIRYMWCIMYDMIWYVMWCMMCNLLWAVSHVTLPHSIRYMWCIMYDMICDVWCVTRYGLSVMWRFLIRLYLNSNHNMCQPSMSLLCCFVSEIQKYLGHAMCMNMNVRKVFDSSVLNVWHFSMWCHMIWCDITWLDETWRNVYVFVSNVYMI